MENPQKSQDIPATAEPAPRSRGTTHRSHLRPWGHTAYSSVRMGNLIANRTLILLYVCAALQVWWLLEQPKGSLMQELPSFQMFMKQVRTYRHYMCMEHYGGATQKPTWLYSGTHDCLEQLQVLLVSICMPPKKEVPYFVEAHVLILIVWGFH